MATFAPNYTIKPRSSTETDRRHLLAESTAPSETSSMIDFADGDRTPRAQSPSRQSQINGYDRRDTIAESTPARRPYKGFPSEEEYLAALKAWAEEKKYIQHDTMLTGFFGNTTMQELASRPGVEIGLKKKWRERKARKEEKKAERRNTVA
jgi:hypothetical protein